MIALCTMFDSAYLKKGLALIASLHQHEPDCALCILALDDEVYTYLNRHGNAHTFVLSLKNIETPNLLAVKQTRSPVEYYWTLAPYLTRFAFDLLDMGSIAYIDADCFLFHDLAPLYAEVGDAPVAICPHRWTPSHAARLRAAGTYNVSWVYFSGLACNAYQTGGPIVWNGAIGKSSRMGALPIKAISMTGRNDMALMSCNTWGPISRLGIRSNTPIR